MQYGSFRMDGRSSRRHASHRNKRDKGEKRGGFLFFLTALLIMSTVVLLYSNYRLYPTITEVAKSQAQATTYMTVSRIVADSVTEYPAEYSDFVNIVYGTDGSVTALTTNTGNLNFICSRILASVIDSVGSSRIISEEIPLGTVFGSNLNSAQGPKLTVKVLITEGVTAHIDSSFTEMGINQTIHRIYFTVDMGMAAIMPSGKENFSVSHSICIAETVIVGKVPQAYTKVSRMTRDISESDIDDIYDFGAYNYLQ